MKRIVLIMGLLLAVIMPMAAQKHDGKSREEKRKEMTEFKIKYLSQEMGLEGDQKEKFAELYKKLDYERMDLFRKARAAERKAKGKDVTEQEYRAAMQARQQFKQKDAELEKTYDAQFSKFLSAKQIFQMKEAENDFNDRIRKMHRDRRSEKMKEKMKKQKATAPRK